MNKTPKIRVSHARSGVNLYLPRVAAEPLLRAHYGATVEKREEGGFVVTVVPNGGTKKLSSHTNPSLPYRLMFAELRADGVAMDEFPLFGVTEVNWTHLHNMPGGTGLTFLLPEVEKLDAPRITAPRTVRGNGPLRPPVEDRPETPHAALGRVLKEFNALVQANDFSDVTLNVHVDNQVHVIQHLTQLGVKLTGKVTRTEELG